MAEQHNSQGMVVHPHSVQLRQEVKNLRNELSGLLLERDHLQYHESKNLEMAYLLAFGALEYEIYETQCEALRLKRKTELIQAQKNRQEKIDLVAIETTLEQEFAAYTDMLRSQLEKMRAAEQRNLQDVLDEQDTGELKRLYRLLVKALHPDLHPDLGEMERTMFLRVVEAFENADLTTMRLLFALLLKPGEEELPGTMEALENLKKQLLAALAEARRRIAAMQAEFPFTMEELLRDEEKIAARKTELQSLLEQWQQMVRYYSAQVAVLLEDGNG